MRILKTIGIILIFCAAGIALGAAAFSIQKRYFSLRPDSTNTETPTATPTPSTISAGRNYTDTNGVSLTLPADLVSTESTPTGFASVVDVSQSDYFTVKDAIKLLPSGVTVYTATSSSVSALNTAQTKLRRDAKLGRVRQTFELRTESGLAITKTSYQASDTPQLTYEIDEDDLYILITFDDSLEDSLTEEVVETMVKSLKQSNIEADQSPSASATSSPLLQSNL